MEASDLERVTRIAQRFLPRGMDYEGIAMDVLIESWLNQVEQPSRSFIRNRCWDALRKLQSELRANEALALKTPTGHGSGTEKVDLNNLMTKITSVLTSDEKKLIWYRFYMGLKIPEIAQKIGIRRSKAYVMLSEALYKMRQEL